MYTSQIYCIIIKLTRPTLLALLDLRQKSFLRTSHAVPCTGTIGSDAGTCCNDGEGGPAASGCYATGNPNGKPCCANYMHCNAVPSDHGNGDEYKCETTAKQDFLGETCSAELGETCEPVQGNPAGNCCHPPGGGQILCDYQGDAGYICVQNEGTDENVLVAQ